MSGLLLSLQFSSLVHPVYKMSAIAPPMMSELKVDIRQKGESAHLTHSSQSSPGSMSQCPEHVTQLLLDARMSEKVSILLRN